MSYIGTKPNVATSLPDNIVTSDKINDGAVGTADIENNAVISSKIADSAVTTSKIANLSVTPEKISQKFTQGTSVATTSGTAFDFTGIPSWVKRITLLFNGVGLSGIDFLLVQAGSGTIVTSGYISASGAVTEAANTGAGSTTGFVVSSNVNSADRRHGSLILTNISGNTWVSNHSVGLSGFANGGVSGGGIVTLSGALDRVRITRTGTNTFSAGSINIVYE